jgi:hypothetical protein
VADTGGQKLFDKTFFSPGHDEDGLVVEMNPGTYVGVVNSSCSIGGYKTQNTLGMSDVWICAVSPTISGVEDMNFENQVRVYPNPSPNGVVNIDANSPIMKIEVYSINSTLISTSVIANPAKVIEGVELPQLNDCVLLKIYDVNNTIYSKIILK